MEQHTAAALFAGQGPTLALLRAIDWSATPLGPVADWPDELHAAIRTVLASRVPMLIWWGPDLVQVYNDAYTAFLGDKHPRAAGQPAGESWPEIWDVVGPMTASVLAGEGATYFENLLLLMNRHGYLEETYWTFSYSPITDAAEAVRGIFVATRDATSVVLGERRLRQLRELGGVSLAEARTAADACRSALDVLARGRLDVPFAVAYLLDGDSENDGTAEVAEPVASYGVDTGTSLITTVGRSERASAVWRVASSGRSELVTGLRERFAGTFHASPLGDVLPDAAMVLPLTTSGRAKPVGVLALGVNPYRAFDDDYRTFFELVAGQVSTAVTEALAWEQEAHRYSAQAAIAEALQRSLLTDPRAVDHVEIAVRYVPAAHEAQVGGDWYDAFRVPDGSTLLVIGDVAGHDLEAAAAMAQVRNLLRGVAHTLGSSPAGVLSALDRALDDLAVDVLATAVVARVEQTDGDDDAGVLCWSNAGHPPPLLIGASGRTDLLAHDAELLLGLDAAAGRVDHYHQLRPGDTVLLYTDGLVERRGASLDDGLAWLADAAGRLAQAPLEALCDALLAELAGGVDDDVALLAVRAHPPAS